MIIKLDKEKVRIAYWNVVSAFGSFCFAVLFLSTGLFMGRSSDYNHLNLQEFLTGSFTLVFAFLVLRILPFLMENPFREKREENDHHAG